MTAAQRAAKEIEREFPAIKAEATGGLTVAVTERGEAVTLTLMPNGHWKPSHRDVGWWTMVGFWLDHSDGWRVSLPVMEV